MGTAGSTRGCGVLRGFARPVRSAAALLHRHRVDPDLSALVAFPSCRCGALLWPEGGGQPLAAQRVESEPPHAQA